MSGALAVRVRSLGRGEFGYLVSPVVNERAAREAIRAFLYDEKREGAWEDEWLPLPPAVAAAEAYYVAHLSLFLAEVGLFRWNACPGPARCYEGVQHSGHLDTASRRGPGVFPAMQFDRM